ncbi:MAG: putative endonuclease [Nitriliruptoraceae bacterium]|jgi:putative endonuclease
MTRHTAAPIHLATRSDEPLGLVGERLAVAHLIGDDGLDVRDCNWRVRTGEVRGELDVVALDHVAGLVVIVEVKARRSDAQGGPLAAVTPRKQQRIRALTGRLLAESELPYRRVRFDVVGLWLPRGQAGRLEHIQGAF